MPAVDHQMIERELRRESVPGAGSRRDHSARPPRASAPHMNIENVSNHTTGGKRSPRLVGNFGGRLPRAPAATRMGFGQDITNMERCRANMVGKQAKMSSLQSTNVPQVVSSSVRPAASHALPRPAADQERHKSVPVPPQTVSISSALLPPYPQDGISSWEESSNIQHVGEYASEIFASLFKDEANFLPRPNYMESQTDINAKMRAILIDWLVEVHMKYKLRP